MRQLHCAWPARGHDGQPEGIGVKDGPAATLRAGLCSSMAAFIYSKRHQAEQQTQPYLPTALAHLAPPLKTMYMVNVLASPSRHLLLDLIMVLVPAKAAFGLFGVGCRANAVATLGKLLRLKSNSQKFKLQRHTKSPAG
jgi:hypothetical protein